MFENVFGYEKKHLPNKQTAEEKKGEGTINTGPMNMPNLSAGYDGTAMLGNYVSDSAALFPEVILNQVAQTMRASENQESARVIMETRVIQNLIYSYFSIVKKNISDFVPKTIMAFLINESRKIAQSELVAQIYKSGDLETLLVEDPMIVEHRNQCRKIISALKHA